MPAALVQSRPKVAANLFDESPIIVGKFSLQSRAAVPVGRPNFDEWHFALTYVTSCESSSPYWIGDLLAYSENRTEWRAKIEDAKEQTGLTEQHLHNLGYISRHVTGKARQLAPSRAHASEVASLEEQEQIHWLGKAKNENLTVKELRRELKIVKRPTVAEGQAEVGVCDPKRHDWFDRFHTLAPVCRICGAPGVVVEKAYLKKLEADRAAS